MYFEGEVEHAPIPETPEQRGANRVLGSSERASSATDMSSLSANENSLEYLSHNMLVLLSKE
jgi:hypothetical protein